MEYIPCSTRDELNWPIKKALETKIWLKSYFQPFFSFEFWNFSNQLLILNLIFILLIAQQSRKTPFSEQTITVIQIDTTWCCFVFITKLINQPTSKELVKNRYTRNPFIFTKYLFVKMIDKVELQILSHEATSWHDFGFRKSSLYKLLSQLS